MKKLILAITIISVILVSGIVFNACTSPEETTTTPTTTTPTTTTPTTTAPSGPQYGGILKLADPIPASMGFGDPLEVFGPLAFRSSVATERLFIPGEEPGTYKWILATGYELAADKSYYDIFLREGVKFHDGTIMDAEAVKWNLDRGLAAGRSEFAKVASIEAVDTYIVRINLTSWDNQIFPSFSNDVCMIISPTAVEENGLDWIYFHPVGTGAFKFVEIENNQIIRFERFDDYWGIDEYGNQLPYLDGVELHIIVDYTTAEASLKAGEIHGDWMGNFTMAETFEELPEFHVWVDDGDFLLLWTYESSNPDSCWSDIRMRQALEYALNKEEVYATMGQGYLKPMYNIIKGLEEVAQLENVPRYYDPEKARDLIQQAGFEGLHFKLYTDSNVWTPPHSDMDILFQEQLAAVGLYMEIETVDTGRMQELEATGALGNDIRSSSMRGNAGNPAAVVVESLSAGTMYFAGTARPPSWPALEEQLTQTTDWDEQIAILVQMEKDAYDFAMVMPKSNNATMGILLKTVMGADFYRYGFDLSGAYFSE